MCFVLLLDGASFCIVVYTFSNFISICSNSYIDIAISIHRFSFVFMLSHVPLFFVLSGGRLKTYEQCCTGQRNARGGPGVMSNVIFVIDASDVSDDSSSSEWFHLPCMDDGTQLTSSQEKEQDAYIAEKNVLNGSRRKPRSGRVSL